jgi:hypothetical protein
MYILYFDVVYFTFRQNFVKNFSIFSISKFSKWFLIKFYLDFNYMLVLFILFNERVMMAITHEDDFVSRAEGESCNSFDRVTAITCE